MDSKRWNRARRRVVIAGIAAIVTVSLGCGDNEPSAAVPTESAIAAKWPTPDDVSLKPGMDVFAQVCSRCHITSEHAPTLSDPKDWDKRIARAEAGMQTLYDHAIAGFGDMMPKGGKRGKDLTDDQVKAAVDYILWAVKHGPAS